MTNLAYTLLGLSLLMGVLFLITPKVQRLFTLFPQVVAEVFSSIGGIMGAVNVYLSLEFACRVVCPSNHLYS